MFASLAKICARALIIKRLLREIYRKKNAKAKKNSANAEVNSIPAHTGSDVQKTTTAFFEQFCPANITRFIFVTKKACTSIFFYQKPIF
jgi:hypothetical protein